jgi:hypothetical protein
MNIFWSVICKSMVVIYQMIVNLIFCLLCRSNSLITITTVFILRHHLVILERWYIYIKSSWPTKARGTNRPSLYHGKEIVIMILLYYLNWNGKSEKHPQEKYHIILDRPFLGKLIFMVFISYNNITMLSNNDSCTIS